MNNKDTQTRTEKINTFAEELEEAILESGYVSMLMCDAIVSAFRLGAMVGTGNDFAPSVLTQEIAKSAAFASGLNALSSRISQ
jgi:hypothetical protein